ncbi:MAG: 3-oxoacyl-ACP synthase III family protein [Myxococcota bacterium]
MPNAYISGTGFYVPPKVVKNDDLRTEFGIDTTDEWIRQRTGIEERRFAEPGVGTADMAVPAAEDALARAGVDKKDIGMIIFATLSPEHIFPGSGVYFQQKLGLCDGDGATFAPAMDVRNQCSGFLYGLGAATSMVQAGAMKHVLLVGSETHSHAMDLSTSGRTVSSLFGDGAGAVVVSATEEDRGVRGWYLGADGRFADSLCMHGWDIRNRPYIQVDEEGWGRVPPKMLWPHMEGRQVFKNAVERMLQVMMKAFQVHGLTVNDVDLFLFHQANLRIIQYLADQIGVPQEKVFNNIMRYGNTTAATIPSLMAEAEREGRLERGMKVCCVAFGSGFTWGSAIIDW